jgi:hypothetical protein
MIVKFSSKTRGFAAVAHSRDYVLGQKSPPPPLPKFNEHTQTFFPDFINGEVYTKEE